MSSEDRPGTRRQGAEGVPPLTPWLFVGSVPLEREAGAGLSDNASCAVVDAT